LLFGTELGPIPGLFVAWEAGLAQALGWPVEGFRERFRELFREGMAKADWKAGVVWVPNGIKYNSPSNPNVVKGWRAAWDEIPECSLKNEAYRALKRFVEPLGEGFAEAFRDTLGNGMRNQEQEQEHEQKAAAACARAGGHVRVATDVPAAAASSVECQGCFTHFPAAELAGGLCAECRRVDPGTTAVTDSATGEAPRVSGLGTKPDNPHARAIAEHIRTHRTFDDIDAGKVANAYAHLVESKPLTWLRSAVDDCAAKAACDEAGGEHAPPATKARMLGGFLKNARRPKVPEPDEYVERPPKYELMRACDHPKPKPLSPEVVRRNMQKLREAVRGIGNGPAKAKPKEGDATKP
jgi:hypothetical protein